MPENYKPHPILLRLLIILIFIAAASGVYLLLPSQQPSQKNAPVGAPAPAKNNSAITVQTSTPEPTKSINRNEIIKPTATVEPPTSTTTVSATITILNENYPVLINQNSSVYDAIQLLSENKSITFVSKQYPGMGEFVEEINGIKNNQATGEYWIYYINGESAKMGVSNYIIKPNDVIKWNYEKANF